MRAMRQFVVRVDNKFTNEIKLKNGVSLVIDTKFEPHKHRAFYGEVVELPVKVNSPVSIGSSQLPNSSAKSIASASFSASTICC